MEFAMPAAQTGDGERPRVGRKLIALNGADPRGSAALGDQINDHRSRTLSLHQAWKRR